MIYNKTVYLKNSAFLVYFLVFSLPFIFFPHLSDPFELPKAAFLIFFVIFTISLTKFFTLSQKNNNVNTPKIQKLLLLYFSIQLIGSLMGINFGKSIWGQYYRYQGLVTQLAFIGFYYLISQGDRIGLTKERLFKTIAVSGVVCALLVLLQAAAFFLFKLQFYTYNGRMTALLGNPNFAGGFLALSFICAMDLTKDSMRKTLLILLFLTAIILTQSRSALLAFSFSSVAIWFPRAFSLKRILILMLFMLSVLILYPKREYSPFDNRYFIWQKGIEAAAKRPVFGWGLENFETAFKSTLTNKDHDIDLANIRVDKAHNELIEIAVSSGLVGLGIWISLLITTVRILWEKRNEEWATVSLLLLLTFFFLAQLNVLNIPQYLVFYLVLGLATEVKKPIKEH